MLRRTLGRGPSPSMAVAIAAMVIAMGGVATAALQRPPTRTLSACAQKKGGQLRLVKAATKCRKSEQKVSWNVIGQAGPAGPTGPAGPAGPAGPTGTPDPTNYYDKAASDSRFLGRTAKADDADKLDGKDSAEFLGAGATAADSDLLDGLDSTAFLGATAKAADSAKLDGLASAAFAKSGSFRRALVTASGTVLIGNGVTASRTSTGVYRVDLGDLNGACSMGITPEAQFVVHRADFISDSAGFDVRFGTIDATPTPVNVQFQVFAICPIGSANGPAAASADTRK
jgi:hypothetical protein